jgi:hypothetical protein
LKHQPDRGICIAALAALLCTAPCLAADPLAALLGCRALADSAARLTCFDRESATLAAAEGTGAATSPTPAAAASVASAAPVAAAPPPPAPRPLESKESFGLPEGAVTKQEVAAGLRTAELTKIDAHIVAVSLSAGGQATFTLDNGQVWRELLAEGDLLAKPGDVVIVSRGMFHSYSLQLKSGRSSKVTRIR